MAFDLVLEVESLDNYSHGDNRLTLQIRSGLKQTVLIDHLRSRLLYLDVRWLLIIVVAFA
jgi:hypothetical protein